MSAALRRDRLDSGVTLLDCPGPPSRVAALVVARPPVPDRAGVGDLLAALWHRAVAVEACLPALGARCEPLVTPDCVGLQVEMPTDCFGPVAAVLCETGLGRFTLPGRPERERLRNACAARLRSAAGAPTRALDLLRAAVFGADHRYGRSEQDRVDGVLAVTGKEIEALVERFTATAPTVSVCGAPADELARLRDRLARCDPYPSPAGRPPAVPSAPDRRPVHRPGHFQGQSLGRRGCYLLGTRGVPLAAPEKYPLHVAWAVLGGRDGLLDQRLRRERALTYSLAAFSREFVLGGYCACAVYCPGPAVEEVAATVAATLTDVAAGRFADVELERARQRLTVAHHLARQSCREVATSSCWYHAAGVLDESVGRYSELVGAVTRQDVERIGQILFTRAGTVQISLVPNASDVKRTPN